MKRTYHSTDIIEGEEKMEKMTVTNKTDIAVASIGKLILKWGVTIFGVLMLVFGAVPVLEDIQRADRWPLFVGVLVIVIGTEIRRKKHHIVEVPLEIYFEEDAVRFEYPEIDRMDGRGVHRETHVYRAENVSEMGVSKSGKVFVNGKAELTGINYGYNRKDTSYFDWDKKDGKQEFCVWLSDDNESMTVLAKLEKSLHWGS